MGQALSSASKRYGSILHIVWWSCALALVGPSLGAWAVRVVALCLNCAPGPGLCHDMAWGNGFRDVLDCAWAVGSRSRLIVAIGFIAAIAALSVRRPLLAGFSLLVLPLSALILPMLAVFSARYHGCMISDEGIGHCALWGADVGEAFHHAALAPWQIYDITPYSVALALMVAAVGFIFVRPRPVIRS